MLLINNGVNNVHINNVYFASKKFIHLYFNHIDDQFHYEFTPVWPRIVIKKSDVFYIKMIIQPHT